METLSGGTRRENRSDVHRIPRCRAANEEPVEPLLLSAGYFSWKKRPPGSSLRAQPGPQTEALSGVGTLIASRCCWCWCCCCRTGTSGAQPRPRLWLIGVRMKTGVTFLPCFFPQRWGQADASLLFLFCFHTFRRLAHSLTSAERLINSFTILRPQLLFTAIYGHQEFQRILLTTWSYVH